MALKLLLHFSLEQGCRKLQIFGYSVIIINWLNKVQHCRNIALITLYEEVNKLWTKFDYISCRHVYMERNSDVDHLSKEGVKMEHETWKFFENREGEVYELFHKPFIYALLAGTTT